MRCLLFLTLLPVALSAYYCPDVEFVAEGLYMGRSDIPSHRLVENSATTPFKTVLDTHDLVEGFDWQYGVRGVLRIHPRVKDSIEALYTYIHPWSSTQTETASGTLIYPQIDYTDTTDYQEADQAKGYYRSAFQNAEINYWRHVTPQRENYFSFSWLLGGRWILLKEEFELSFKREIDTSSNTIHTTNRLYGLQLGAVLEVNPNRHWTWTFQLKGAGFLNTAKNSNQLRDENNTFNLSSFEKECWTDTYLIEASAALAYHFGDFLSIEAGYQGMMITGLALAPAQVGQTKRHVSVHGDIVLDGAFAGLTFSF